MSKVKLRAGESVDRALRSLKKKVDREGIMKAVRSRRFYNKPSVKKKEKSKAALRYKR